MKKHILYVIFGVILIFPNASYSKQGDQGADAARPKVSEVADLTPENIFSLTRNGESVTIGIKVDFAPCQIVQILRNTTGKPSSRNLVAQFAPDVQQFVDTLPDAQAYWYWVKVQYPAEASQYYGPMRIVPDDSNSGKYSAKDNSSKYSWTVSRTSTAATITWNFPGNVSNVAIKRNSSKIAKKRTDVLATKEWKSTYTDTFTDPDADYWYWIEATLPGGAVISQGPLKAEFVKNQ